MNELDKVAEALHELFLHEPACYVWELEDRAEIVLNRTDVNPCFANRLIPLYTRDQLIKLLGEDKD